MKKYIIRAHYNPGVVRLGTIEATDNNDALHRAELMGWLDDKEADDFTADRIPDQDLSKILGDAIKSASGQNK